MLSGGEKTRLALASLVVSSANVLLLDEPTNNLDPASREEVLAAIRTYAGAIVLVTHDEGAVRALEPDRVLICCPTVSRTCGTTTTPTWSHWPETCARNTAPRNNCRRRTVHESLGRADDEEVRDVRHDRDGAGVAHLRTDRSIADNRVDRRDRAPCPRRSPRPHRRLISGFLGLTVVDASLVVVTPLFVKQIVDAGILQGDTRGHLVLGGDGRWSPSSTRGSALAAGYLSSRIGEGLIYDLRIQVFAHVQRQSLAFFTRTQTGALVSRLNNDVIGAQRAFTSTLSSTVSNAISVLVVGITMLALSWQVTLLCLALFPLLLFVLPVGERRNSPGSPANRWTATPTWATR